MMKRRWGIVTALCLVLMLVACGTVSDKNAEQYNAFMAKAEVIEDYSKENYETAELQSVLNEESYQVYLKWDALLNEVYQFLKIDMDAEAFAALEAEELAWIKMKESAVEAAGDAWKGGSAEPMARNAEGIKYTRERCYYLISLVKPRGLK